MRILIDDVRTAVSGVIIRTAQDAREILKYVKSTELFIDHDLGEESDQNGYELLKWILRNIHDLPEKIVLVTSNPAGRKNMHDLLSEDKYISENGTVFKLKKMGL